MGPTHLQNQLRPLVLRISVLCPSTLPKFIPLLPASISTGTLPALLDPAQMSRAPDPISKPPHSTCTSIKEPLLLAPSKFFRSVCCLYLDCCLSFHCTHKTIQKLNLQQLLNKWEHLLLQVYVWVHFSLHNPKNHKSCQSQLSCHHQNGFWIQIQRWHLVWSCTFWLVFPEFLS